MQHEIRNEFCEGRGVVRRSVPAILARKAQADRVRRQEFPPDFLHGEAAVAEIYATFGEAWVERAFFVVDGQEVKTAAYFDDYFLVMEQWVDGEGEEYGEWLERMKGERDRVIRLSTEAGSEEENGEEISIEVDRGRLLELERTVLGVVRDGFLEGETVSGKLRQGHVDIL